ncbi:GreA/GreB family elongation factor [Metalysinibacillus jejuensis]|uniref:GreA/GreB family elongation factor n=1 Tax=Metalysinibacillus jejuensis TaxID=914327 RepID=UPI000D3978DD|nr:GreA/GreB family elongation factor [Metalysinibacillus jejuensis]
MELTKEGIENLQKKLQHIQHQVKEAEQRVLQGRTFCDFSDDPTYQQAFDDYMKLRDEEQELAYLLRSAKVVDTPSDIVALGTIVTFQEEGMDAETYQIVTSIEADVLAGKISVDSPMAQALIGKKVGDEVEMNGFIIVIKAIQS